MKLKFFGLVILTICTAFLAAAQTQDTSYWNTGGFTALTFSQVYLSDSWSAGGENATAINAAAGLFADYRRARHSWETSLDLGFGQVRQGEGDFEKSDDKINMVTKYGYQIKEGNQKWFFSGLLDFRTQFAEGTVEVPTDQGGVRDSVISNFMAPGYLTVGLGVDYKPTPKLSINYIPLTGKFTFVTNDELAAKGAYGVDPGSNTRAELGSYLRIKFKDEIVKNVTLDTRLELFSNYIENFGTIDVNWQNVILMKINEVLSASLFTNAIYDEDIKTGEDGEAAWQFKNVFGAGLAYRFGAERAK